MIHSIDEQGNLIWECRHWPENTEQPCGQHSHHHISHEQIQWAGQPGEHQTVRLPPCEVCGAQTFLKVHFTEEELRAPNMWLAWTSERAQALVNLQAAYEAEAEETPQKAALAYQIKELEAIRNAGGLYTKSHQVAQNHMQLRDQLIANGKVPGGKPNNESQ